MSTCLMNTVAEVYCVYLLFVSFAFFLLEFTVYLIILAVTLSIKWYDKQLIVSWKGRGSQSL
jgi:hypothetical protein